MDSDRTSLCTVRLGYFQMLLAYLAQTSMDLAQVYGAAALADLAGLDPLSRRPVEEWDGMVSLAEQHAGKPDLAFELAQFVKPWDTGTLGFMTMACRDLREATEALAQFHNVLNDVYTLHGEEDGKQFDIRLNPVGPVQSAQLEKYTLGIIAWHARWLSQRPGLVFNATFRFASPPADQLPAYQRTFGGRVHFNCDHTGLSGPAEYAGYAVSQNPYRGGVQDKLRAQLMAEMASLGETSTSFVHRLERIIQPRLEQGELGLEEVAQEMGLSSRTLQNRLEESGLTYRGLLDRIRHAQALVCMGDASVSLIQMAQMLGFATQSTFHRAFKRWTGMSPGQYRRARQRHIG